MENWSTYKLSVVVIYVYFVAGIFKRAYRKWKISYEPNWLPRKIAQAHDESNIKHNFVKSKRYLIGHAFISALRWANHECEWKFREEKGKSRFSHRAHFPAELFLIVQQTSLYPQLFTIVPAIRCS